MLILNEDMMSPSPMILEQTMARYCSRSTSLDSSIIL